MLIVHLDGLHYAEQPCAQLMVPMSSLLFSAAHRGKRSSHRSRIKPARGAEECRHPGICAPSAIADLSSTSRKSAVSCASTTCSPSARGGSWPRPIATTAARSPNLARDRKVDGANQLWVADIRDRRRLRRSGRHPRRLVAPGGRICDQPIHRRVEARDAAKAMTGWSTINYEACSVIFRFASFQPVATVDSQPRCTQQFEKSALAPPQQKSPGTVTG
jgi:hypothetical protein